jgi:O-antigen ligase
MLCALVVAGGVKGAPWLSGVPDLTLVAWLGTVFAIVMQTLKPGTGVPRLPVGMLLAVPLVAMVVASTLWSLDEPTGASKALQFELVTMTAFVAPVILIRSRAALVRLSVALVAFGLLIALTAVRTSNLGQPVAAAGGNEIQAALYPAVGVVCIATYLVLLTHGARRRLLVLLPLVVLVPATFGAGSRGVVIAAIAVALYAGGRAIATSRRRGMVLAGVAAALLAGMVFWPYLAGPAADRYKRQLVSTDVNRVLGDRAYLYEHGLSIAASNPISGVGAGGFAYASLVYEKNQYPHNIFLEFAAEEGVLAAGLFGMLVIAAWRARLHASVGVRAPETLFSGALILLFLAEAMVSFDINSNRGLWFALGVAFALPGLQHGARNR